MLPRYDAEISKENSLGELAAAQVRRRGTFVELVPERVPGVDGAMARGWFGPLRGCAQGAPPFDYNRRNARVGGWTTLRSVSQGSGAVRGVDPGARL